MRATLCSKQPGGRHSNSSLTCSTSVRRYDACRQTYEHHPRDHGVTLVPLSHRILPQNSAKAEGRSQSPEIPVQKSALNRRSFHTTWPLAVQTTSEPVKPTHFAFTSPSTDVGAIISQTRSACTPALSACSLGPTPRAGCYLVPVSLWLRRHQRRAVAKND